MRVSSQQSAVSSQSWQKRVLILCLLPFAFCLLSCGSVPNLEKPECSESRNTVREFYSVHFGNPMKPSEEYFKLREKFLTKDLKLTISKNLYGERDYFTATENYPKAFRVGECEAVSPDKTVFGVLLFWKTDTTNEQREVKAEVVKEDGKWLINKIF